MRQTPQATLNRTGAVEHGQIEADHADEVIPTPAVPGCEGGVQESRPHLPVVHRLRWSNAAPDSNTRGVHRKKMTRKGEGTLESKGEL